MQCWSLQWLYCSWTEKELRKLISEICPLHYITPQTHKNQHLQKFKIKTDNIEQDVFKDGREQEMVGEY